MSDRNGLRLDRDALRAGRRTAVEVATAYGHPGVGDDAALVISELLTNAMLHGGGVADLKVIGTEGGVRIEVYDRSRLPPVVGRPTDSSLTGRGMKLVTSVATRWGTDLREDGKVVWAEVGARGTGTDELPSAEELLDLWGDDAEGPGAVERHRVELGDVPTELLLDAKAHVDNVLRELTLASSGARAGSTAAVPAHLQELLGAVERFAEARLSIKRQALEAAESGVTNAHLTLELPASAAEAAEEYLAALDEIDSYCRAQRMLTLESPPQHRVFRRWYVGELVKQLRALATGQDPEPPMSFDRQLLRELDRVAEAQRASERAARLFSVASALAVAATPEAIVTAVLTEGVAALGAAGGGVVLAGEGDTLAVPGAVGYDDDLVDKLRAESPDAELPAAVALRTGEAVWLETRDERDRRFPELLGFEASTVALCAVPLVVQGRRIGAMRFSFHDARLFDEDERRFVLALAAQTAQALDRAQLQHARLDVSRRLQRSLLPPTLPSIPGMEVAVLYRPFGDGLDIGGDFYDVWELDAGRWGIAIGDVAGTGPEAASVTALARHTLRAVTLSDDDPRRVLTLLNRALLAGQLPADVERFCTLLFGVLRIDPTPVLTLASGGHPPPFVWRRGVGVSESRIDGSLLGLLQEAEVGTVELALDAGDVVLLVTDGVLEARNERGDMLGSAGVGQVLDTAAGHGDAAAVLRALEEAVLLHCRGHLHDDVAAVVLRRPAD